jgi:hypothetical protein
MTNPKAITAGPVRTQARNVRSLAASVRTGETEVAKLQCSRGGPNEHPQGCHGELLLQQLLAREGESEKARGNMSHDGMLALAAVFLAGGAMVNLFITIRLSRSVSALLEIRRSIAMIPDVHSVGNKR